MSERKFKYVGTRPIRHDGVDKVTGRANYGADLSMPGMLHGVVLRSPHAHARILGIDTRAAERIEGVHAVITAADLPELDPELVGGVEGHVHFRELSENCMARDKALYHGHAVAAVAATSLESAREAAQAIEVTYEPLESALSIERAIAADAPILHPELRTGGMAQGLPDGPTNIAMRIEFAGGDLDAGFEEADVIVERDYGTQMVHQGYIEPHACVASAGEDGRITIWCCTQGAFVVRDYVAGLLELEPGQVKVVPSEIGGGFGGKTTVYLEPLAAALSRKAGRPVKMVMSREEVFRATGPTSGSQMHIRLGARRDGTLVAVDLSMFIRGGSLSRLARRRRGRCARPRSYTFPNFRIEAHDVVVNKPKVAAYRAPGAPMGDVRGRIGCSTNSPASWAWIRSTCACRTPRTRATRRPTGRSTGRSGSRTTLQAAQEPPALPRPAGREPGPGRGLRLLVQRRHAVQRRRQPARRRQRGGRHRQPRHRRLARLDGADGRGGTGHSGRARAPGGRRHRQRGLHRPDRRQPHHGRHRHGRDPRPRATSSTSSAPAPPRSGAWNSDAVGWEDGRAMPLNGAENEHEPLSDRRAGPEDGPDRRPGGGPRLAQRRRQRARLRHPPVRHRSRPRDRPLQRGALHRGAGRRQGGAPQLRRGADAGRSGPGNRLGAQRGVHLRLRAARWRTRASSTTACRSPPTCR